MKFGLRYCNAFESAEPGPAIELVQAAEEAGFESAWASEHPILPLEYGSRYPYTEDGRLPEWGDFIMPDPLVWISFVAGHTTTLRFGTAVLILPVHNPVILAKQVASLDRLTGGRLSVGIGVGWMKEEFDALGTSFGDRGRRADEYVEVMRALWTQDRPSFSGEFFSFGESLANPKPVSSPVPIVVGGDSKPAARRAGRLAQGFLPVGREPWDLIELARETAEAHGRNPADLEVTMALPDDLDDIAALAERGVDRLLVPCRNAGGRTARVQGPEGVRDFADVIADCANV